MNPLLVAVTWILLSGGALLVVLGLRPVPVASAAPRRRLTPAAALRSLLTRPGRFDARTRALALAGLVVGLLVFLTGGWPVAVLLLPVAFPMIGLIVLPQKDAASIGRLEAMEEWTRSLAGVLTVGVGLEQAIIATLRSTPPAIHPEVSLLVARLRARMDTREALTLFADDLDDATGDLIASSLRSASRRKGPGLSSVLEGIAETVGQDVRLRRSVEAERSTPRTIARVITLIFTGAALWGSTLPSFTTPYGTALGQMLLLVYGAAYLACLWWMRNLAQGSKDARFMGREAAAQAVKA